MIKPTVGEQPKEVSTLQEVEEVSEKELQELEADIKSQKASEKENPKAAALASQTEIKTLAEIIELLSKPIHPKYLKKLNVGPAKGATYVPWPVIGLYLDHYAPGWSMRHSAVADEYGVTVITDITIPTADFGLVTRSGVGWEPLVTNKGTEKEKLTGFGGASPIASRMSSKRASVEFGLGKYLYKN